MKEMIFLTSKNCFNSVFFHIKYVNVNIFLILIDIIRFLIFQIHPII